MDLCDCIVCAGRGSSARARSRSLTAGWWRGCWPRCGRCRASPRPSSRSGPTAGWRCPCSAASCSDVCRVVICGDFTCCDFQNNTMDPATGENKCDYCGKGFSLQSNLKRHIRRIHVSNEPVKKSVVCSVCDYKCRDNYQLTVHLRTHSKEKLFNCSYCEFISSRKEDCRRHMKKCQGPKYKCTSCGKTFKSKVAVNEHTSWDAVCGSLGEQDSSQHVVRIAISSEMSVLGRHVSDGGQCCTIKS